MWHNTAKNLTWAGYLWRNIWDTCGLWMCPSDGKRHSQHGYQILSHQGKEPENKVKIPDDEKTIYWLNSAHRASGESKHRSEAETFNFKCHRSRVFFGNLDCDIAHFKQDTTKVFDDLLTATWSLVYSESVNPYQAITCIVMAITSPVTLKHSTETPEQAILLTTTSNGAHARMSSIS